MLIHFETNHQLGIALGAFELKGGMADVVFVEQYFIHCLLDKRAFADGNIVGKDVRRERAQTAIDAPHMDVMDAAHAVHGEEVFREMGHIHVMRGIFKQDIERLAQDRPRVPQDEQADQHADERIEEVPAREQDHHARDHRADRG